MKKIEIKKDPLLWWLLLMSKRKKVVTVGLPKAKQNKLLNESCGQQKGPEVCSKLEFNIIFISFVN